jgi:hypothetical protein
MQLIENIVLGCLMCPNWSSIPVLMINHVANIQNSVTGGSDKSIVSMKVCLRLGDCGVQFHIFESYLEHDLAALLQLQSRFQSQTSNTTSPNSIPNFN